MLISAHRSILFNRELHHHLLFLFLITLFVFVSVDVFYRSVVLIYLAPSHGTVVRINSSSNPIVDTRGPMDGYRIIADRNLFGSTNVAFGSKENGAAEQIVSVNSTYQLKGTVAGDRGFAVIEDRISKKQRLYKVGDHILDASVIKILRDSVVVKSNEREEVLKRTDSLERPILQDRKAGQPKIPESMSSRDVQLSKKELTDLLRDAERALQDAQIRPYYNGGKPEGLLMSRIKANGIYQKLGFMEGDILYRLNQRDMVKTTDITELFDAVRSGESTTLQIKRQGHLETIHYVFR